MKTHFAGAMVSVAALLAATAASASAPWLEPGRYGEVRVVVAESASPSERTAATEFQKHWQQCTGHAPPIATTPAQGGVSVWIGRVGLPESLLATVNLEGLGDDGLCIRTATPHDLLIVGGQKRGTLYGVYQFFEDYMGVRWLAPDATYIPPVCNAIPQINFRYVPAIWYRDTDYWMFTWRPEFAVKHRFNGDHLFRIPEHMGGNIEFVNATSSSLLSFVSPEEYGKTHPEYFSEVNGKRLVEPRDTQLCLTNPDVLRITVDKTLRLLRTAPPARRIVTIAQMQTGTFCGCDSCRVVREREGGDSGALLTFVNHVAEAVEKEFPDARIKTSAFGATAMSPKTIRPRDNVIVEMCAAGCDFTKPYAASSSAFNSTFRKNLRAWSGMTNTLFAWDCTQNRYSFQQPHPNVDVLQPNIAFFVKNGVTGLFAQGAKSPHSDFDMLKAYLLSHAVWNPNVNWESLYAEFLDLYYGPAAPYLREYLDLAKAAVVDAGFNLTASSNMDWVTFEFVEQSKTLFEKAFAAVGANEALRQRLDYAYLPVQHAALMCPPRAEMMGNTCVVSRPPSQTFDEYWDMIMQYGVTYNGDGPILDFRAQLDSQTPPRRQEVQIQRLENAHWEVYAAEELSGAVLSMRDKRSGVDWFRPADGVSSTAHRLQDWEVMDPEKPLQEKGIDSPYTVTAQTNDRLTYETKRDDGLVVRRTITLEPGSKSVEITFEVENTSSVALTPRVKLHPEFWTQGDSPPEFWVERDGQWKKHSGPAQPFQRWGGGPIERDGVTRWAIHLPKKGLTLINTVRAEEIQNLFFYFNQDRQAANLEVLPLLTPLNPGEKRSVHLAYTMSRKAPRSL
ncbi:MAG TPA: DUF4838 domain-containing protein [Candidatus Hydrogenedentes bacterium]|nr:DUF4838 domain-containing protein [Candidatus Hydrogenedentota bacterium]